MSAKQLRALDESSDLPSFDSRRPLEPMKPLFGDDQALQRFAFSALAVLTVWRFAIGLISHVIWEEGHFVVSGEYLAFGYPDIPAGYPWLARLITSIFGWHIWPLRIVGLAIATAIPFAVYFLSTPITTRRNALWAAVVSMALPPAALNGTIFYPEGGLQLLLVLMCGCLIRAIQDETPGLTWPALKWWVWAGVCAGLGQLVHFRFLIPGLAVVVFMLATPQGRALWSKPGVYITAALGFLGLVPALIYNAQEGWPAIAFHVVNRPRYDPQLDHIIGFVETQFGIVTPLFFIALCAAAKVSLIDDRKKVDTLLGYQAVVIFLFYVGQATINKKIMPHWPFMAYLPLLPYVPGILIRFAGRATGVFGRVVRIGLIATGPLLALLIGIAGSIYQWQFRHSAELPPLERQHNIMQNENYSLLEPDLAAANARAVARFGPDIAWATSGHRDAVHMEFPADGKKGRHIYTLGDPYDAVAEFTVARRDWKLDLDSLVRDHAGKGVVLILNQPDYLLHESEKMRMYQTLCGDFEEIEPFKVAALPPGRTEFDIFTARVRVNPQPAQAKGPCPLIPSLYIANPQPGRFIDHKDTNNHYGMAADPIGIDKVDILIDGKFVVTARNHLDPGGDSTAPAFVSYDPNYPKVQFDWQFPQGSLTPGEHGLSFEATRSDGSKVRSAQRILYVK